MHKMTWLSLVTLVVLGSCSSDALSARSTDLTTHPTSQVPQPTTAAIPETSVATTAASEPLVAVSNAPAFCQSLASSASIGQLSTAVIGAIQGDQASIAVVQSAADDLTAASTQPGAQAAPSLANSALLLHALHDGAATGSLDENTVTQLQQAFELLDTETVTACGFGT